ncbi:MAG TPA: HNH endonuclease [Flexivirga sp.]|uniref:HNH endonuclease signature motif containing protein n=1 Tax=Flexivirga sp. TaxID=1962927 RepID=UPI002C6B5236|nr:HNH endonuclease [Flexivirga sp.]HWC20862.1 HNH endonuclease [Flexivirga sp.]
MIEMRHDESAAAVTDSPRWESSASDLAMSAARHELAKISAQLNDGHARLVTLMRRVLAEELWCGAGFKSPEHWLTAYAGLTWSSAHDIVRIAERSADLPTMQALIDDGKLTLGQAAVVAKYTPSAYDADVAEFASYTTVTQLRRALCRYNFRADAADGSDGDNSATENPDETGAGGDDDDSVVLPGDDSDNEQQVDAASDAAQDRAPGEFDPAAAPPRLDMRYVNGRFRLVYDAPADLGALVEQALLEAKDTLFRLRTEPPEEPSANGGGRSGAASQARPSRPGAADCGDNRGDASKSHRGASFGEAMSLMAQRSLDDGAPLGHSRASRYRIYLHLDTLGHGWLNKGCSLPQSLRDRVLCDGVIQPIWETEGKPINVGRAQRIVPARTRRLLEDRDRGCRFPGCLAMHHLECHHLDHWINGGRTDADRMIMLCPFHHDEHHRGAFVMVGDPSKPAGVVFTARDGTRVRPEFLPYDAPGPPGDDLSPTDGRHGAKRPAPSRDSGSKQPPFAPYAGPVNETLHLSLVRFGPKPPVDS